MDYWKFGKNLNDGKYVINSYLSHGQFGVIYTAKTSYGHEVAIKTIQPQLYKKPFFEKIQQSLVREAAILSNLKHPCIVSLYDTFKEDDIWCMVLEYVQGIDLLEYVKSHEYLMETEALKYIFQIGSALNFMHNKGYLHLDVLPQNIMLRKDKQEAVLIDFGLAHNLFSEQVSTDNSKDAVFEDCFCCLNFNIQNHHKKTVKHSIKMDIYGLAVTLYILLTGKLPIPAPFKPYMPLEAPKIHNSTISDAANKIVLLGMALEAEEYPKTVLEWLSLFSPA